MTDYLEVWRGGLANARRISANKALGVKIGPDPFLSSIKQVQTQHFVGSICHMKRQRPPGPNHHNAAKKQLVSRAIKIAERTITRGGVVRPVLIKRDQVVREHSAPKNSNVKTEHNETALSSAFRNALNLPPTFAVSRDTTAHAPKRKEDQKPVQRQQPVQARSPDGIAAKTRAAPARKAGSNQSIAGSISKRNATVLHPWVSKNSPKKLSKKKATKQAKKQAQKQHVGSLVAPIPPKPKVDRLSAARLAFNKRVAPKGDGVVLNVEAPTNMTFEQLRRKWVAALKYLSKFGQNGLSMDIQRCKAVIETIEAEWTLRHQYLTTNAEHFEWPTTNAPKGDGDLLTAGWHDTGMLGYLEYSVSKSVGSTSRERQALLQQIYIGQLPPLNGELYTKDWFVSRSAKRLQKMAESIAAFVRNNKRRSNKPVDAIARWEEDLQFLHNEFYVGVFDFGWPST